ncbi:MAG: hypothetical protein PHD21_07385 [Flavobacteriales bacterium]|nr:hypothetical protein [Flavobacteriales bacterium]
MMSMWGVEAAICAHFHWSRQYLLNDISWVNVQLMLADAPTVEYDGEEGKNKDVSDFESPEDIMAYLGGGK